jgi:hypothetical protein
MYAILNFSEQSLNSAFGHILFFNYGYFVVALLRFISSYRKGRPHRVIRIYKYGTSWRGTILNCILRKRGCKCKQFSPPHGFASILT